MASKQPKPTGRKPDGARSGKTATSRLVGAVASQSISPSPGSHPCPPAAEQAASAPPISVEVKVRLQALALPEPGGGYSVLIPSLGIATQGDTLEEVQANAVEAAEGWLASMHDSNTEREIRVARGEG